MSYQYHLPVTKYRTTRKVEKAIRESRAVRTNCHAWTIDNNQGGNIDVYINGLRVRAGESYVFNGDVHIWQDRETNEYRLFTSHDETEVNIRFDWQQYSEMKAANDLDPVLNPKPIRKVVMIKTFVTGTITN